MRAIQRYVSVGEQVVGVGHSLAEFAGLLWSGLAFRFSRFGKGVRGRGQLVGGLLAAGKDAGEFLLERSFDARESYQTDNQSD